MEIGRQSTIAPDNVMKNIVHVISKKYNTETMERIKENQDDTKSINKNQSKVKDKMIIIDNIYKHV